MSIEYTVHFLGMVVQNKLTQSYKLVCKTVVMINKIILKIIFT